MEFSKPSAPEAGVPAAHIRTRLAVKSPWPASPWLEYYSTYMRFSAMQRLWLKHTWQLMS